MSKIITLRKGLDINLAGKPRESLSDAPQASEYALSPLDFEGVTPKLLVKVGDKVKAGTPLFFNKYNERVLFTSPVSGTVAAVNRGEKRKVLSVTVTPDGGQSYEEFGKIDLRTASREQIVELLLRSGLWPMIVQRPYGVIADPNDTPKAVFISAFDSAPLAPDYNFVLRDEQRNLQAGIELMRRLTPGKVHLSVRAKAEGRMPSLQGVELHAFAGKHPVGNVGVQIHHVDPINKGDIVWTVNIQDLAIIGRLVNEGRVDMRRIVAVTGSEIENPHYVRIVSGARVDSLVSGNVRPQKEGDRVRFISGNVLTGVNAGADGYLRYPYTQVTVIPEGDDADEFMGWASVSPKKMSTSRSFPGHFLAKKLFNPDARLLGGRRAMIMSGQYDDVVPLDILPEYLIKAIIARDIDRMEQLGIYEVAPEDFALAEYVDTSKLELQKIVREGLDYLRKELE